MKSKNLKAAVIGLGMGRHHAKAFSESPDAELVAIADVDPTRLEEYAPLVKGGNSHIYTDYQKMLEKEKPDIVAVALPNSLHMPVTLHCLEAGAHVFCEKPMALNLTEARMMRDTARKKGLQLGINLSYRLMPEAQALKALADDGFLGTPYHAYCRWTRRDGFPKFGGWFGQKLLSGGGPLIDLGVHRIDLASWLMGDPEPIAASAVTHEQMAQEKVRQTGGKFDCEDLAAGLIRFEGGISMVFEISWAGHQALKEDMVTRVMGTGGTLVHRNTGGGYGFQGEAYQVRARQQIDSVVNVGNVTRKPAPQHFVEAVRDGRPVSPDAEDGLRIQRILDALYSSAEMGKEVRIEALPGA